MPIEILMPALSPTMKQGNLAKWLVKEGSKIVAGDVIAEIETDKATMEVEAVDDGVLGKIIVSEGTQDVAVNEVIALILADGEDKKSLDSYKIKEAAKKEKPKKEKKPENSEQKQEEVSSAKEVSIIKSTVDPLAFVKKSNKKSNKNIKASPLAKKIAAINSIDIENIQGTGPDGRIIKEDVANFLANANSTNIVRRDEDEYLEVPNDNVRKVIAARLLESKVTIPHFYLSSEFAIDDLTNIRTQLNNSLPKDESGKVLGKISVNDMIVKAASLALRDVPAVNASWTDAAIIRYNNVDVSIAVATDTGLITPIVRNSDQKSLFNISSEIKSLAKKAKQGALAPEEFQGGGFSISNLGMYGVNGFYAIVNPPQSCILAIGAIIEKLTMKSGNVVQSNFMNFNLSCDHRVVDGAVAAIFLQKLKYYIENPVSLIL
jgi:pyruvate dehydrogenase E2 component (dihydrolipoamide acetyltransferase)